MTVKWKLFSLVWLLLLVPVSVGVLAYKLVSLPSPSTFAQKLPTNLSQLAQNKRAQQSAIEAVDASKLEKYLAVESALLGVGDNVSVYFKDERSEKEVSLNSVRSWIPASTIKAFVVVEAFRQRDLGLIDFNQTVTIQAQNVVPTELETDEFPRLREGTLATIQQLVEAMVIQSDNTAYNTLLDILDRRNINTTLKNLGITQSVVGEKLNLDDDQAVIDLQIPSRQPNTITAKDLSTLFDLLYSNKISGSNEILAIFKRQKINTMIPALLPPDTVVAHKTGDWAPIYHDGGIIYKPDGPFILSVFTNSNDPDIVAQLARVAYYRTAQVVGQDITVPNTRKPQAENTEYERIYLAEAPPETNVLAAQTDATTGERTYTVAAGDTLWNIAQAQYGSGYQYVNIIARNNIPDPGNIAVGTTFILPAIPGTTFPPAQTEQGLALNAADLGVTENDLRVGKTQTNIIGAALILPGSPLHLVKQWLEQQAVNNAKTSDAKIEALLNVSKARLGEVKRELAFDNVTAAQASLTSSEEALREATNLAKTASNNEVALFKIKQLSDVHFGILHEGIKQIQNNKKEAYIDAVYAFYRQQKKDIQTAIASTQVASPLQQKPTIGVISEVKGNVVTVKSDDGKTTQVVLTPLTPARVFEQTAVQSVTRVQLGEKIAVVGRVTPQAVVTAQFILRNVPKDLPLGHRGKVIEIDPKDHIIKLQDTTGKIDTVIVGDQTTIKSKDTNVSLTGIKAGSTVTVVGTTVTPKPKPSSTAAPTVGPTLTSVSSGTPGPTSGQLGPGGISKPGAVTPGAPPAGTATNVPSGGSATPAGPIFTVPNVAPAVPAGGVSKTPAKGEAKPTTVPAKTGATVQATTVVVVKNSSGKNEKVEGAPSHKSSAPSKPSKPAPPQAAPPPETKKPEEKK